MESEDSADTVRQCPLCQMPMGSKNELQLHYLTSCSGYDRVSNEQPRSKLTSRNSDSAGYGRGGGGGVGGGSGYDNRLVNSEDNTSTVTECNVQFMWQPTTALTFPFVTLLASFQKGSVELTMDTEGGHYASKFVNIAKGSYEGQLVIGDSFVHPIKEFTVSEGSDIIVLHFKFCKDCYGRDQGVYEMQTNPSYHSSSSPPGFTPLHFAVTYSNPMYNYPNIQNSSSSSSGGGSGGVGGGGRKTARSYQPYDDMSTTSTGSSSGSQYRTNLDVVNKNSSYLTHSSDLTAPGTGRSISYSTSGSDGKDATRNMHMAVVHAPHDYGVNKGRGTEELAGRLEEIGLEREDVKANQTRVRLRQQLGSEGSTSSSEGSMRREVEELKDRNTALEEQIREYSQSIMEQNEVIRNISSASTSEARQLLDQTKRQQMQHAESFAEMKEKIEEAMKMQNDYIKVSQENINLTAEMQDYKERIRSLLDEIRQKDEEIGELKHTASEKSTNRMSLELSSMREKCDGWREEVERLLPLEDKVKALQKENEELAQQVTLLVEEGERRETNADNSNKVDYATVVADLQDTRIAMETELNQLKEDRASILRENASLREGNNKVMDYDTMMARMTDLQDTRVAMETELHQLREERASILQENASLREGSQPQHYANLKIKCETITKALHDAELALTQEKKLTNELQGVNLELHQKLVSATDPERLRSIQDKMVRYKSERDTAKSELEDKSAALIVAEREAKTAQDAMVSQANSKDLKLQLKQKEEELADSRREVHTTRSRMTGYREERNKYREQLRVLKQQLQHAQQHLTLETAATGAQQVTPRLEGAELDSMTEVEVGSPGQEYGSPTLQEYDQYTSTEYSHSSHHHHHHHQQQQRDCDTPSDGTASPSFKHRPKMDVYAQTKPKAESCMSSLAEVRGKDGVCVAMEIQKPSVQLNSKQKPQVVVKRESGYETGTLLFVGPIGGKELAGVCLDNRLQSVSVSKPADGHYKDGRRYFKCQSGYGLYVPLSKIFIEVESATV